MPASSLMDEYAALSQRVVLSMDDVRGCLVLSRDGMVLGAYPEEDEATIKPAWLRFVGLGETRKSFVEFPDQIWAFVNRGPYSAFVVASVSVRPGVLIDQLEQALLTAEESRTKRETLKLPDAASAPSGKPRTSLHPAQEAEPHSPVEAVVVEGKKRPKAVDAEGGAPGSAGGASPPPDAERAPETSAVAPEAVMAEPASPAETTPPDDARRAPQKLKSADGGSPEEGGEIDRVLLAKEFSGLLQMETEADEGSS